MKNEEMEHMLDNYFKWLKDTTVVRSINDTWTEITTPYLDPHNDYIQIYAKKTGDVITLTDDSYTLTDLEYYGCPVDSPRRKEALQTTLCGFGVQLEDGQLVVRAGEEDFPQKKSDLVQAILAVHDLLYTTTPHVQSFFFDDVVSWLDSNEIRYMPDIRFIGKSGFDNKFDFGIPKSKNNTERLVQTISNPTKEAVINLFFRWIDTKEKRPAESKLIALINDSADRKMSDSVCMAFNNYDITPILWTERDAKMYLLAS